MERLTRKSKISDMVWFIDHENRNMDLEPCEMNPHHNRLAIQKLAEYEEAEEQGLLLRLPCKLWDKLYWISDQDYEDCDYEPIEEVEVCEISFNGYSIQLWFSDKGVKEFPVLPSVAIGNELFLTKEEAEAALEKMKGEEHENR